MQTPNWMENCLTKIFTRKIVLVPDINVLLYLQGVQDDIKTLQLNVDNLNELSTQLLSGAEPVFSSKLQAEVKGLNEKWQTVVNLSHEQNARLVTHQNLSHWTFSFTKNFLESLFLSHHIDPFILYCSIFFNDAPNFLVLSFLKVVSSFWYLFSQSSSISC